MNLRSVLSVLSLVPLSVACAASTGDPIAVDVEEAEVTQRVATAADIAHACSHAQSPPGGVYIPMSLTVASNASSPLGVEHNAYNMTVPGTSASRNGWARYVPDETAEHAIYTDPSISGICVKLSNAAGTAPVGNCLTQAFQTSISAATCPGNASLPTFGTSAGLSFVRSWNLTGGQTYFVKFSKTGGANMFGLFENLDEI